MPRLQSLKYLVRIGNCKAAFSRSKMAFISQTIDLYEVKNVRIFTIEARFIRQYIPWKQPPKGNYAVVSRLVQEKKRDRLCYFKVLIVPPRAQMWHNTRMSHRKSQWGCDGWDHLCDQPVEIKVAGLDHLQVFLGDLEHRLVVKQEVHVQEAEALGGCEDGVVRLHHDLGCLEKGST